MKTKKAEEFIKHAQKRARTKFAVVGKGTSWTIYEGTDLSNAVPGKEEQVITATCENKQTALSFLVVGGSNEIQVLKTKVFAPQVKKDPKALKFKELSGNDNSALEKLQDELDGSLAELVKKLPEKEREGALALLNEAKLLVEDGEVGPAGAKVAELKRQLGSKSGEQAERDALLSQLQGTLVGQVAQHKGTEHGELLKLLNQAIALAMKGDLQVAKDKVAQLREALGLAPAPDPREQAERAALLTEIQGPLVGQVVKLKGQERDDLIAILNKAIKEAKGGDLQIAKDKVAQLRARLEQLAGDTAPAKKENEEKIEGSFQVDSGWWDKNRPALLSSTGLGKALKDYEEVKRNLLQDRGSPFLLKNYSDARNALNDVDQAREAAVKKCGSGFKKTKAALEKADEALSRERAELHNFIKVLMDRDLNTWLERLDKNKGLLESDEKWYMRHIDGIRAKDPVLAKECKAKTDPEKMGTFALNLMRPGLGSVADQMKTSRQILESDFKEQYLMLHKINEMSSGMGEQFRLVNNLHREMIAALEELPPGFLDGPPIS